MTQNNNIQNEAREVIRNVFVEIGQSIAVAMNESSSLNNQMIELENAIGNLESNFDRLAYQVAELAKRMGRPQ